MIHKKLDIKLKTRLFPYIENINKMNDLKIDHESVYYISLREDAEVITSLIKNAYTLNDDTIVENLYITDATAGVGGNTISFGKNFKYVNSIEIESTRFKYLKNNIDVYELTNVNVYNENCLDILDKLYSDIIFFDPPWGGKDYKNIDNIRLTLSDKNIEDICLDVLHKKLAKLIVIKLPLNYDINFLKNKLINYTVLVEELDKMMIVIIKYHDCNS